MTIFALAGGSFIFLGVLLVGLFGLIYGYFTYDGSGIGPHPSDGRGEAAGAEGESEPSGKDQGVITTLDTHGTK